MKLKNITLTLVGVALCGLILTAFSLQKLGILTGERNGLFSWNFNSFSVENMSGSIGVEDTKSQSILGAQKISVSSTSTPVLVKSTTDKELKVELKGYYKSSGKYNPPQLEVSVDGDTINVDLVYPRNRLTFSLMENLELTLYVPESFNSTVQINTTSGDIELSDINLDHLSAVATSGNITANSDVAIKSYQIETTSGSQELEGISGNSKLISTSGNIQGTLVAISEPITIESTSGSVNLVQIGTLNYNLDLECTSGEVTVNIPITLSQGTNDEHKLVGKIGDGGSLLTIQTTSGDIDIDQ